MKIALEVVSVIWPPAILAAACWMWVILGRSAWAAGLAAFSTAVTLGILWFFRDPPRTPPLDARAVVAPADGTVAVSEIRPDGSRHVAIFMSVFNVHVNRAPLRGTVRRVSRTPGTYFHAGTARAAGNARVEVELDSDFGPIRWRQISGLIARRIACHLAAGDSVALGQRFGIIYFGSRMEVDLPPTADLAAKAGERVRAGESIIARFRDEVRE